jgi:DNA polymerase
MWKIDARGKFKDTPELRQKAGRYCQKDTAIMFNIMDRTKPLSAWETQVWNIDQQINDKGIPVDLASIRRIQARLDDPEQGVYRHLQNRVIEATDHYVGKLTQTAKFKEWLNTILPDKIPNLQAATVERYVLGWDALEKPDHVRDEAWEAARQAFSMKSFATLAAPKKYKAILDRALPSAVDGWGIVYDSYVFEGAHTGRWTAKGVQTQNLLRRTAPWWLVEELMQATTLEDLDDLVDLGYEPIQIAGEGVRPIIRALPKHKLLVGDFSKIETCVLFWLSNAKEGLRMLRSGQDVYCDLASAIYNEKVTKDQPFKRLMGKQGILGLGYGCGAPTFVDMLRDQHRVLIPRGLAQRTVEAYRQKYKAVVSYWYDLQAVIRKAIRDCGTFKLGPLTIMASTKVLVIKLPSGRKLRYRYPEVSLDGNISFMGVHPKTKQWARLRQWGGGFTENVVQAIANDLLRQAMVDLTGEGYKLIMHSHDELVAHEREKQLDLQHFTHVMEFRKWPKGQWWEGIPIEVESFVTERYTK